MYGIDWQLQFEEEYLAPTAAHSAKSRGRSLPEDPCPLRNAFQRDRDRILHCNSFRRLKHKTQVFLSPRGDHYRTRLTHTLEVSQIARTIARALRLNEDLTEAIALGHDLGHTPFGHAGERALDALCPWRFRHYLQSVRVTEHLERGGKGLNLTWEVKNGIACHSRDGGRVPLPKTLEGQAVRLADKIAYVNHDIEDAIRAGVIQEGDLPWEAVYQLGRGKSARLTTVITSIAQESDSTLHMSPVVQKAQLELEQFLYESVYTNPVAKGQESKAEGLLSRFYEYYCKSPEKMPAFYQKLLEFYPLERVVCDYIAGMTDQYAVDLYETLFIPRFWTKE
ncbi:MAG: deoxyguanosinetriphosphate triphosphohydrolase [Candidatus Merdivicinus sp.]|jgi:dGTPase